MDPHSLADALMDPMMMMLGTMVALSGAYIAIAMQELNAANAAGPAPRRRQQSDRKRMCIGATGVLTHKLLLLLLPLTPKDLPHMHTFKM